jgi:DNA-binding beta-propeller fold protein YncE
MKYFLSIFIAISPLIGAATARADTTIYEPTCFDTLAGTLNQPWGVAVASGGTVYVADTLDHTIRKITPAGVVTLLAGTPGTTGFANNINPLLATFSRPTGVAVDAAGNVYVADYNNHAIRKITASGAVTTVAGTGSTGSNDGVGTAAAFNTPFGVALNSAATLLYVTDQSNQTIRQITLLTGNVVTYAGLAAPPSYINGSTAAARFNAPRGIAVDSAGNVYVADAGNMVVRKISGGVVSTFAGDPAVPFLGGFNDGQPATARFSDLMAMSPFGGPCGVAVDSSGNVYVSDQGHPVTNRGHSIRKITAAGVVTTLAGTVGVSGYADGTGSSAAFNYPAGIAVDTLGKLYVADALNNRVRNQCTCVTIDEPQCFDTLAGAGTAGSLDGTDSVAEFNQPWGVAVAGDGTAFVADTANHLIRKITSAGVVTTLAGQSGTAAFADGSAFNARFSRPTGVAVNSAGTAVYVADYNNQRIRKIDLTQLSTSPTFVTTVTGSGVIGTSDGVGVLAEFHNPFGVALNSAATLLYVSDQNNQMIREITISTGTVITFAGTSFGGYSNGAKATAAFNTPKGIAVDSAGNVYVADTGNMVVRKISGGVVSTLAGDPTLPFLGGCDDGMPATARFSDLFVISPFGGPCGLAVDAAGNVYVSDQGNPATFRGHTIRKITPAGFVTTIAGSVGVPGSADGTGSGASFHFPAGIAIDSTGRLYVADVLNHKIRVQCTDKCVESIFVSYNNGTLRKFDTSGTSSTFATVLNKPKGLAINSGLLFVANTGANAILSYSTTGGASTPFSSAGLSGPYGLAFDASGDLYAANYTSSTIQRLDGSGLAVAPFPVTSPNMNGAFGIAIDTAGNVYTSSHNNNTIQKFTSAGVFISDFVSFGGGLSAPRGLAIRAGVLYVANYITSVVTMFDLATGTNMGHYATLADGVLNPVGIAFDDLGRLYVANAGNRNIMRFTSPHVGSLFSSIYGQAPEFIAIECVATGANLHLWMKKAGVSVNENAGTVTVSVGLSAPSLNTVNVSYATSIGTATALDYTPTSSALIFAPGDLSKDIIIPITNDALVEANESFTVTLSSPTGGAVLGTPTACKVSIIDPSALTPLADTQAPVVKITSFQVGGETVTASASTTTLRWRQVSLEWDDGISVIGTATDNKGVKMVEIRVTPAGTTPAAFMPVPADMNGDGFWPYIGPFYPWPGLNVIDVRATDFAGNSTTVSRTIKVLSPLLLSMNPDQGSVSSGFVGSTHLEVGKTYTVIATAKSGFIFDRWGVNNTAGTGITPLKQELPSLTFIFQEGLVLTAQFIPNPFLPIIGSYNGLVSSSPSLPAPSGTVPSVSTEGCFTATVSSTGNFTGKLKLDGLELPITGLFDNTGAARFGINRDMTLNVSRPGKPSIVVDFQLDVITPGTNDRITGTVKQYYRGGLAFLSDIEAFRAFYDGKTPATTVPDAYLTVNGAARTDGIFSCVITNKALAQQLPVFTSLADYPRGYSYATIKVSKGGGVSYACMMADSPTSVTGTSTLSKLNEWALFAPLYNKLGCIRARVTLDASNTESDMSSADFRWFRPQQNSQHYPYGWAEGISADLRAAKSLVTVGQSIIKSPDGIDPGNLGDPLPAPDANGNTALSFFDIFVDLDIAKPTNLNSVDGATFVPAFPGTVLKITRASGVISGTLKLSDGSLPKFQGISYQKGMPCGAFGFYLSVTPKVFNYLGQSGDVCLMATP